VVLADLLTIREHRGTLAGLTVTFLGDGASNMAQSYLLAGAVAGMHVRVASPLDYAPDPAVVADATALASANGGSITLFTDPVEAVAGVDVVVTDTWVSMGKEDEKAERIATFGEYSVDSELMARAKDDALFLHCLPADRGFEVAAEVIDGEQSVIWDEAENRLHAQKALMVWLLERA
jgi:ornithine carbamoyltransferase